MRTYAERYQAGEYAPVWDELTSLGTAINDTPALLADARAVAQLTMQRVAVNLQLLLQRLHAAGYVFDHPSLAYIPPSPHVAQELAEMEQLVGPLPLALHAWFAIIGHVNLMGYLPEPPEPSRDSWSRLGYPDPLVVLYPFDYFQWSYQAWQALDDTERAEQGGAFCLEFAPDPLHKENVSGGEPYEIALPCAAIDAPILNIDTATTFVPYLRHCFAWGGFPGFATMPEYPRATIAALCAGMLPF